jgi:hypothetical protein
MAKKTESTAVNDLINLVATQGPSVKDPGADLFSDPPKKNARMTATLSGAGTVEPLPRTRAPAGTQQNASVNPPVRVSTAMPRASSIPPIPDAPGRGRPALPPPRSSASMPRPPIPSAAKIALPAEPELDVELDEDDEADLLKTPVAQQPRAVAAPITASIAPSFATLASAAPLTLEPVYPRAERGDHPNAAPDMTGASPWFESSGPAERHSIPEATPTENTAHVQRPRNSTLELAKKLALPMGIAIILGVFVGGYIVFDGQGGKKRSQAPVAASADNGTGTDPVKANENAVAVDTNAAEPAKTDELVAAKTDDVVVKTDDAAAKTDGAAAQTDDAAAKTDDAAAKTDDVVAKTDDVVAKTDEVVVAKIVESAKVEPAKVEPAKVEPAKVEPAKVAAEPKTASVLGGAVDSLPAAVAAPTKAKPLFVDIRIDSTPPGADVSLVDRGKTMYLGPTPISASVDPARSYDVVFTYANRPTQIEHLDPKKTTRLAITLGKSGNQAKEVAKAKAVKTEARVEKAVTKVETPKTEKKAVTGVKVAKTPGKVADPFEDDTAALERKLAEKKAKAEAKPEKTQVKATTGEPKAEKAVATGEGVLMISSKPPCEIFVDGKATGLMTPQRAMKLPAGKHKITLVSPDKTHKKTIAVEITPDKPTKVIQDLLK